MVRTKQKLQKFSFISQKINIFNAPKGPKAVPCTKIQPCDFNFFPFSKLAGNFLPIIGKQQQGVI